MNKVFIVVAEYESSIHYGIDCASYLCGVYTSKEDAERRVKYLSDIIDECHKDLHELEQTYNDHSEEDPEGDIFKAYQNKLGFSVEPSWSWDTKWNVEIKILEKEIGDVTDCPVGGACYLE